MSENKYAEDVSQDEYEECEKDTNASIGLYRCRVTGAYEEEMSFMTPPCMGIKFQLEIIEAYEVNGETPDDKFSEQGKQISDTIGMPTNGEDNFRKKRRLSVASVLGLLDGAGRLTADSWLVDAVGRDVIIHYVEGVKKIDGKWQNTGFKKVASKIGDGWRRLETQAATETDIDVDDI